MDGDSSGFARAFETRPLEPFDMSESSIATGDALVQFAKMTGQRWERSTAALRRSEIDAFVVNMALEGGAGARGIAGERTFVQRAGEAVLCDLAQTSLHDGDRGDYLQLMLPRKVAEKAGFDVRALHGVVLSEWTTAMLRSHLLQFRRLAPQLSIDDGPLLSRTFIDLLMLAVTASGRAEEHKAAAQASTLAVRARNEIEHSLGSPRLTVANLCRQLGTSRSTLYRLFEAEGGPQAYIRNRRLEAALQALLDPNNRERIGALAERLGFSDAAHLSRLFRNQFGETPSDCRAGGLERGEVLRRLGTGSSTKQASTVRSSFVTRGQPANDRG